MHENEISFNSSFKSMYPILEYGIFYHLNGILLYSVSEVTVQTSCLIMKKLAIHVLTCVYQYKLQNMKPA